ncbi:MAG: hypothetical protein PSW75_02555, partial [bacterium]|nr:hypothetical protein [bacterium]
TFDQTVLEMIEHSPVGAVPFTPTYQDALKRLYASHQVYASADFKDGHVTVRSLAKRPLFHAANVDALVAGSAEAAALESNSGIFDRYLSHLPDALRAKAEAHRLKVVGRPLHHRKHGAATPAVHDPVHSLFLVPGTGPHHGLPGNYLYGSLFEIAHQGAPATWAIQLHDTDDGASTYDAATLAGALEKLQEVFASAPFHLSELAALGFKAN